MLAIEQSDYVNKSYRDLPNKVYTCYLHIKLWYCCNYATNVRVLNLDKSSLGTKYSAYFEKFYFWIIRQILILDKPNMYPYYFII